MKKKKIIVIGNGFDLNLGLPTSYSHFLKSSNFNELFIKDNQIAINLQNKKNLENWVDVEACLKDYADQYSAQNGDYDIFKNNYIELLEKFSEYLNSLNYNKINEESRAYKFIVSSAICEDEVANVLIYNFNYTPTIKNILIKHGWSASDFTEKHIHVHGNLDSDIVFGIQDDTIKTRIHTLIKKATRPGFKSCNLPEDLQKGYDIAVFGYSLGVTDEMYFNRPFSGLSSGAKSHISDMELYYHGESGLEEIMFRIDNSTNGRLTDFQKSVYLNKIDVSE